jgi:hypothetical protein
MRHKLKHSVHIFIIILTIVYSFDNSNKDDNELAQETNEKCFYSIYEFNFLDVPYIIQSSNI